MTDRTLHADRAAMIREHLGQCGPCMLGQRSCPDLAAQFAAAGIGLPPTIVSRCPCEGYFDPTCWRHIGVVDAFGRPIGYVAFGTRADQLSPGRYLHGQSPWTPADLARSKTIASTPATIPFLLAVALAFFVASVLLLGACQTPPSPTATPARTMVHPATCHARQESGQWLPDPACTPGALNPAVTQADIRTTICMPGWATQQRTRYLPSSLAARFKRQVEDAYGIPHTTDAEGDHVVPIELGGLPGPIVGAAPFTANFWPERNDHPRPGVLNSKDLVEDALNHAVCSGRITLAAAQHAIETDWTTAEHAVGLR